jgi:hypothetical protein
MKWFGGSAYSVRVLASLAAVAAVLMLAPAATADPYTSTDYQYLAALNHGSICCPLQQDMPIWNGPPDDAIRVGHRTAEAITAYNTYQTFRGLSANLDQSLCVLRAGGEMVVLAIHYYAPHSVEKTFINDTLGGPWGEASYWYGPEARKLSK